MGAEALHFGNVARAAAGPATSTVTADNNADNPYTSITIYATKGAGSDFGLYGVNGSESGTSLTVYMDDTDGAAKLIDVTYTGGWILSAGLCGARVVYGADASDLLSGLNIDIKAIQTGMSGEAYGLYTSNSSPSNEIGDQAVITVNAAAASSNTGSGDAYSRALYTDGGANTVGDNAQITVTSEKSENSSAYGLSAAGGTNTVGTNTVGNNAVITVSSLDSTTSRATGLGAGSGGSNTLGSVTDSTAALITVTSEGASSGWAYGLSAGGGTNTVYNNVSVFVSVETTSTTGTTDAYGLWSAGGGKNELKGDVSIATQATALGTNSKFHAYSLWVTGSGSENLLNSSGTIKELQGDVYAEAEGTNTLVLDTAASYLQGNITRGTGTTTGTNSITVSNGAAWRPVYDNRYGTDCVSTSSSSAGTKNTKSYKVDYRHISALTLENSGVIDMTWDGWTSLTYDATAGEWVRTGYDTMRTNRLDNGFRELNIDNLSGSGGILRIDSDLENGDADTLTVGTGSTATSLKIQVNYDNFYSPDTVIGDSITNSALVVTDNSGNLTVTGTVSEYNEKFYQAVVTKDETNSTASVTLWNLVSITEVAGPTSPDGGVIATEATRTAQEVVHGVSSAVLLATNSLTKRLGDLRKSGKGIDEQNNLWATYSHGTQTYAAVRDTDIDYNEIQVGYDRGFATDDGKIYRGIAISHTDGDTDYARGSGETNSTSFVAYQTWIGDSGHYYDLTARYTRVSSEYAMTDASDNFSTGDYDTWAMSASGEYGYRYEFENGYLRGFYAEPSAELIVARIADADYTTSTGMEVHAESSNHVITRLGLQAGKTFDAGTVYARANYYHEFSGNGGGVVTGTVRYEEDDAENWGEIGIGGHVKFAKTGVASVDLKKMFGDVKSDVTFSIRGRWSF